MNTYFFHAREPMNSLTHLIGALLSTLGTFLLVAASLNAQVPSQLLLGALVFGLSLVALYSASSLYHYVRCSSSALVRLRKLDHAMIYVLIAGTYTPLFLAFSPDGERLCMVIWGVALAGILLKIVWISAPRWLSTLFYLMMGWAIVFDPDILGVIPVGGLGLIAAGGVAYTIGAIIYALKKPNWFCRFGFHELFHVFVLLGSLLHFIAVYVYVI